MNGSASIAGLGGHEPDGTNRPNLLFLSPTLPHHTGTGTAIRAGVILEALAKHFNVYVLHVELWGWHEASFNTDFVRQRAARYVYYVPQSTELPVPLLVAEQFAGIRFHAIHAFRLLMARAALSVLLQCKSSQPYMVIDLDDDEGNRAERLQELWVDAGESERASTERKRLPQLRGMERVVVPRFQAICLAAPGDCETMAQRYPASRVVHLPNAVFLPHRCPSPQPPRTPRTLLFVGTLDYVPNQDGVLYFCSHILPLLRQKSSIPLRVRLVGAKPGPRVQGLSRYPDVEVIANVPDLEPYYASADLVIVPLRAGSGTRIKILEAFSFGKPVVSTSIGAEGLAVRNEDQLLIADQPEAFANACLRLMDDPLFSAKMSQSSWRWLLDNHSPEKVNTVIQSVYEPVLGSRTVAGRDCSGPESS